MRYWNRPLAALIDDLLEKEPNRKSLRVSGNDLTGPIPATIGGLAELEELSLSVNPLECSIPAELGKLTKLKVLNLSSCQLTGSIPSTLANLVNLEYLDLSENQLTGPIPATIGGLAELEELDLHYNGLSGAIPSRLSDLYKLKGMRLYGNALTGSIPNQFEKLANLQHLDLSDNRLTGMIPATIGDLFSLQYLDLRKNQLVGAIPCRLGGLYQLEFLSLAFNALTGRVPKELANLPLLDELYLNDNQLTEIATELDSLPSLLQVSLWENPFADVIPGRLAALSDKLRGVTGFPLMKTDFVYPASHVEYGLLTLYVGSRRESSMPGPESPAHFVEEAAGEFANRVLAEYTNKFRDPRDVTCVKTGPDQVEVPFSLHLYRTKNVRKAARKLGMSFEEFVRYSVLAVITEHVNGRLYPDGMRGDGYTILYGKGGSWNGRED